MPVESDQVDTLVALLVLDLVVVSADAVPLFLAPAIAKHILKLVKQADKEHSAA